MVLEEVSQAFDILKSGIPTNYQFLLSAAIHIIFMVLYAIFIYKFYKFLARRDIFEINLYQYNKTEHPLLKKIMAIFFFILEYAIIMPLIVTLWLSGIAILMLIVSSGQEASQIMLISAAIVGSARIASYFNEELSKDLAKLIPFGILAIFLTSKSFFGEIDLIERINQIPDLFSVILGYIFLIAIIEIVMRVIFLFNIFAESEEVREETS